MNDQRFLGSGRGKSRATGQRGVRCNNLSRNAGSVRRKGTDRPRARRKGGGVQENEDGKNNRRERVPAGLERLRKPAP